MKSQKICPFEKWVSLVFATLLALISGIYTTWGFYNPYAASYFWQEDKKISQETTNLVPVVWALVMIFGFFFSPFISGFLGPRMTMLFSVSSMGLAMYLATLVYNFYYFLAIYASIDGFAYGVLYTQPIYAIMVLFPDAKGTASGVIAAGYSLSAILWGNLAQFIINPDHLEPSEGPPGEEIYFGPEIANRFISFFRIASYSFVVLGGLFSLLVFTPDSSKGALHLYIEGKWESRFKKTKNSRVHIQGHPVKDKGNNWSLFQNSEQSFDYKNSNSKPVQINLDIASCAAELHETHQEQPIGFARLTKSVNLNRSLLFFGEDKEQQRTIKNDSIVLMQNPKISKMRVFSLLVQDWNTLKLFLVILMHFAGSAYFTFMFKTIGLSMHLRDDMLTLCGSLSVVMNAIGKILGGLLCDMWGFKKTYVLVFLLEIIPTVLMIFVTSDEIGFSVCLCLVLLGYGMGVTINPAACLEIYGRDIGPIAFALINSAVGFGSLVVQGFAILGNIDGFGFNAVFVIITAMFSLGILLVVWVKSKNDLFGNIQSLDSKENLENIQETRGSLNNTLWSN